MKAKCNAKQYDCNYNVPYQQKWKRREPETDLHALTIGAIIET